MTGKLVRDKIPAIIHARGQVPVIGIASPGEYRARLAEKLAKKRPRRPGPTASTRPRSSRTSWKWFTR